MQSFIHKYQPKSSKEVVGQASAIVQLKEFFLNFKKQKKRAVLVYGPSGVGKTCSIYAIANDLSLEVLEVNASDFRTAEQINTKVGAAALQQSLFSKGKVILVDEIDGLAGNKDRGGIQAIIKLMQKSAFPMVLTATNPFDNKFGSVRSKSTLVEFKPIEPADAAEVLKRICKKEKIKYDETTLKSLARRTGGDLRAAINDLQTLTQDKKQLVKETLDELGERNKLESILNALVKVFKSTDPKIAITAFDNVEEDLDKCFLWVDENLPHEYKKPADLARAYDKLSRADVFRGRIRRWQHWRFMVYENALLSAGVAVSKDEKYKEFTKYKPTGRLLKLWWAKQKNMKKKAIAAKIAEATHTSTRNILKDFEYFKVIFKKNKEMSKQLIEQLNLDKDEVAWLKK
ncbi:replication factor C large subunit [Candidatus Woesearchaeota archaeon]|nr:replication factor C large subunit [Candidatus Woesearchaeota archaeon]